MLTPTHPPRPLADLLTALEAAVRTGDRARTTQLAQMILQRLASEAADRAGLGRRVLMAALDQPAVHLSTKLHDAPHFGYFTPYTLAPGLDVEANVMSTPDIGRMPLRFRAVFTWVYSIVWKTLDARLRGHNRRGVIPARSRLSPGGIQDLGRATANRSMYLFRIARSLPQ